MSPTELRTGESRIAYFSSVSENTARFVTKLGMDADRLPLRRRDPHLQMTRPFVLIVPTYGGGNGHRGAVPKQVIAFLNDPANRELLRGVVAAGNTNFGADYCAAGKIISAKCRVPLMYRFELLGNARDVQQVRDGISLFFADEHDRDPSTQKTPEGATA